MRVPSGRRRTSVGANMTPMIDVVFLLIIFFLVSSHLARQENRLPLELPVATTTGAADLERTALTISVDPQARWRIGGNVVAGDTIDAVLRDHRAREGESAAIRIRTDRSVPYRAVEPLLRSAAKNGIFDVSISALQEDR